MILLECVADLWRTYRIALLLFLYNVAYFLYTNGFSNLAIQKICFLDGPPGTNVVCNVTAAFLEYNNMNTYRLTVHDLLSGLMVMIGGSWRDQTGLSRPLALMAAIGEVIGVTAAFISSLFWNLSSWPIMVVDSLMGIMGSRMLVCVACVAHVVDHASLEQRVYRIAIVVGSNLLGSSLGNAMGGYVLSALNYRWYFVLVGVIYLSCIALCFHVFQNEKRRNKDVKIRVVTICGRLKQLFMPRENFLVSWLVIFANLTFAGAMYAESAVAHSFFQKVLALNPEKSGLLSSFRLFSSCIMSFVAAPVLGGIFKLSDFTISIFCTIPSAISCFCMAFVKTLIEAYIYYGLDMMRVALMSIMWTVLLKCIKKTEIGVYSSCLAFGEALIPLLINPLYLLIFNHTIDIFPGAFYLFSGSLILFSGLLLTISYFCYEDLSEKDEECAPKS